MNYYDEDGEVFHNYIGDSADVDKSDTLKKIIEILSTETPRFDI